MYKYNIAHKLDSAPRTKDVLLSENDNCDFTSMLLPPHILQGLNSAGFIRPSPIQLKAIPLARCGFDLIVQAKSGTGKTCVFSVTALENIISNSKRLQVIVLAPTREIAQQVQHVISAIGCYQKKLKVKTFIGGIPLHEDKVNLINCQIAVGAPGRLRHLIEEKLLAVDAVRLIVLDEADKLLEDSFQNDINYIFQCLPENKQVIACSATYTNELLNFLNNYMQNATHVTPGEDQSPLLIGLRHLVFVEPESHNNLSKLKTKEACLLKILSGVPFLQCLIFSNYHSRAESICNSLKNKGWKAMWIAGKQDQKTRTNVMSNVKDLKVRVLVTTDLTARGIDLHEVNLVINMDIPSDHQTYLHRMGRAGRYGGHGMVITIITDDEMRKFRKLLGCIGGSYASAFVIGDNDISETLWSKELTELEQVFGIPSDDNDEELCVDENSRSSNDETDSKQGITTEINNGITVVNTNEMKSDCQSSQMDIDIKVENESVHSVKNECPDDSDKASVNSDLTLSDFSGNNENISDISDLDESEQMMQMSEKAITEFGLKLLNYSINSQGVVQSFCDLERSLSESVNETLGSKSDNCKTLLEPSGTIDVEVVEEFIKKSNNKYNSLINSCQSWDFKIVSNILLNENSDDCLSKILDSLKIEKSKEQLEYEDPELHSGSSSDDDSDNNSHNNKFETNPKVSDNLICHSQLDKLVIENEVSANDNIQVVNNCEIDNYKKRKTNSNASSASSSSVEGKSINTANLLNKKSIKQNYKKMKQTETNDSDSKVGFKKTVLFYKNKSSKGNLNENKVSSNLKQDDNNYNLNDEGTERPQAVAGSSINVNYTQDFKNFSCNSENDYESLPQNHHSNRPADTVNRPMEVENWYKMWHQQEAHLKWYLGYSKYLNYMLNPNK